jgi:tetratricopeptide (TPR) repeat protein
VQRREGAGRARPCLGQFTRVRLGRRALASILSVACCVANLAHAAPPAEPPAPATEPPEPPDPQTAAEWYARGYELGVAGDYAAAAAAFLRSYELKSTAEALFNAALAYEQAGATIDAITTYERFLAEPAPPRDLVEAAQLSIDTLLPSVAVLKGLRYTPEQAPAELFVNGERVELDEFPRLVLPGEIEIEVVAQTGARARESYELAAGEKLIVDLRGLLPAPEPPPPEIVDDEGPSAAELAAARARAQRSATLRKLTWVGLGMTGASAIAATTLGLLALHERRLYEQFTCFEFTDHVCPPDFSTGDVDAHHRAYTRNVWGGTIVAGVSGGFAIATLVIGLVSVRSARTRSSAVRIVPAPAGIGLRF